MTEGGTGAPLTPDEEDAVTRMLAAAGGPVAMPADVVARLDDVLRGLEEERASSAGSEEVADVVRLRARRRWPRALLAAAAVVVGGYAAGTLAFQGSLSGSDSGATAASDSAAGSTMLEDAPAGATSDDDADADEDTTDGGSAAPSEKERVHISRPEAMVEQTRAGMVRLRSARLDAGALRAVRALEDGAASGMALDQRTPCPPPDLGPRERSLPVRYDGVAAVLVAGPERGGAVEVTVYDCDGDELDSTVVRP